MLDRLSIEVTNLCPVACAFCYNGSGPDRTEAWDPDVLTGFVRDCAEHDVASVSLGGGEPLAWEPLYDVLRALDGVVFRSLTTSGRGLEAALESLVAARPDKVHVSIHNPWSHEEVERVVTQVLLLDEVGIRSGVDLLVRRSELREARAAVLRLREVGVGLDRMVLLPMRGGDTPVASDMGKVAGRRPFQSTTCLLGCGRGPRFCSLDASMRVGWCSYTTARRPLPSPTWAGLRQALDGLEIRWCGHEMARHLSS